MPRLERREVTFVVSDAAAATDGTVSGRVLDRELPVLPSRFLSPRHAHGAHEVCWVLLGRCVLTVEARALAVRAGDVCVVRPGEMHQLRPAATLEPFDTLWRHHAGAADAGRGHVPLLPHATVSALHRR